LEHSKVTGMRRIARSIRLSNAGLRYGFSQDAGIREGLIALAVLVPVSALLPVTDVEHLILVLSMMLVILVEFVNSAIEAAVDRVSLEHHPLAGRAKDLANTAVVIAVLMTGLCWVVIAGPLALRWLERHVLR
jgi:diacylglycerol kinase (ATP)